MSHVPFLLLFGMSIIFVIVLVSDVLHRVIPNKWTLLIFVISMAYNIEKHGLSNLLGVFSVLAIGLILWRLSFVGGGDVKLLVAISPLIEGGFYTDWLFLVSLVGAVTSLVIYVLHKYKILKNNSVPYSIAIVVGSWLGIIASII